MCILNFFDHEFAGQIFKLPSFVGPTVTCSAPQFLVSKGEYGFALNNGVPEIYFPGRHVLMSPLADYIGTYKCVSAS